jgi:hypothetical protein
VGVVGVPGCGAERACPAHAAAVSSMPLWQLYCLVLVCGQDVGEKGAATSGSGEGRAAEERRRRLGHVVCMHAEAACAVPTLGPLGVLARGCARGGAVAV